MRKKQTKSIFGFTLGALLCALLPRRGTAADEVLTGNQCEPAKEIALAIPPNAPARADKVIR